MEEKILRLFKAYLGRKTIDISEKALKYGLLVSGSADLDIINEAIKQYGKDGKKWNETFHKSLSIIKNTSNEDLFIQQIIHYITTYGFEKLGIYSKEKVYIPVEELNIPELDINKIELLVISPITEKELSSKIMNLITSSVALSKQTIEDILSLSCYIDKNRIEEITNRELKIALCDEYNIVPKEPEEFLRYLIYVLTGNTLKIQNDIQFKELKNSNKLKVCDLLEKYLVDEESYNKLSSIFLRNKKLFLALKISKKDNANYNNEIKFKLNRYINKLRKLANKNHKPLKKDILDMLTQDINIKDEENTILSALDKVTIFREVRILNGISYRLSNTNYIVYKIRNGSSYATELRPRSNEHIRLLKNRYNIIKKHLISRVSKNVKDKKIFIPKNVSYTVPTSEKQFNGNFPDGSYIEIPRDNNLIYGIHWNNLNTDTFEERVDLDLKQISKTRVFGWDHDYKSSNGDILFSGDITDAPLPDGATELFYVSKSYGNDAFLITVNNFTGNDKDIPYEFIIAKANENIESDESIKYILDPNNILEKLELVIPSTTINTVVGLIKIGDNIRLYLNNFGQGNSITSSNDTTTLISLNYLQSYSEIQLKLYDLLKECGAILTDSPDNVDYNLSINSVTRDTLISLLSNN